MITSKYGDFEEGTTTFHHNGDFSGDVTIVRGAVESEADYDRLGPARQEVQFEVPYEHLEKLVIDKLRSDIISKLENASHEQLKKLFIQ